MKLNNMKSIVFAFFSTLILLLVDFISKRWALEYLALAGEKPLIEGIIKLQYVENRGAAFGILSGKLLPVVILTPVIVLFIIWLYLKCLNKPKFRIFRLTCILFIAGSLGNFIDRVIYGFVVDFFEFQFFEFPVFNIADIYLSLSTLVLILLILFYYKDSDWNFIKKGKDISYGSESQDNNLSR